MRLAAFASNFFLGFVQFLPLSTFLLVQRTCNETDLNTLWREAFTTGGAVAVAVLFAMWIFRIRMDRLLLATHVFLAVAFVSFVFQLDGVIYFYRTVQEAMLPTYVAAAVIVCMFLPTGFADVDGVPPATRRKASLLMLVVSLIAFAVAWFNRTHMILGGTVPFLMMLAVHRATVWKLSRDAKEATEA